MKNLVKDLKNNTLRPFYMLYGIENYLINFYKNEFKNKIKDYSDLNIIEFNKENFNDKKFIDSLNKMPFFSDKKLIIIDDIKLDIKKYDYNWKDGNEKVVKNILYDNKDNNILIYINRDEKIYERTSTYKFFNENGYVVELNIQNDETLIQFSKNRFEENNKVIDGLTLAFFINKVEKKLDNIVQEINKLVSYVGDRNEITKEDVLKVTTSSLSNRVFDMIKYINNNDKKKAYIVYSDILALDTKNNSLDGILSLLKNNYNFILSIKSMKLKGADSNEIMKKIGINSYQYRDLNAIEKMHDENYFINKIKKLYGYTVKLRKGSINREALMEVLIG